MDANEVRRYLDVSLGHAIVVDVQEVVDAPGNLRTITIHRGNGVTIEFQSCADYVQGNDEGGGLKYVGEYGTLDELILDLEAYLGKAVTDWSNYTLNPYEPKMVDDAEPAATLKHFEDLVRRRLTALPAHGGFELAGIYWRHIDLFGEYRPDLLGEETKIALRKRGVPEEDL